MNIKYLLLVLLFLRLSQLANAQKEVKVHLEQISATYSYPALLQEFTKSTTYKVLVPKTLNYNSGMEVESMLNVHSLDIPGKFYQPQSETDYTIEIVTTGLTGAENKGDRFFEKRIMGQPSMTGYVRDYKVFFPCTLNVYSKKEGKLKSIQIFSNTIPIDFVFDKNMVQPIPNMDSYPFSSPAEIERIGNNQIYKILERSISWLVMNQIKAIVQDLVYSIDKDTDMAEVAVVKKKKREFVFDDIDSAIIRYKEGLSAFKAKNYKAADSAFTSVKVFFENLMGSHEPRIDKNVVELMHYNLALCNFWLKNFKETKLHLEIFKKGQLAKNDSYSYSSLEYRLKKEERRSKLFARYINLSE